jgi:hypothetical protein
MKSLLIDTIPVALQSIKAWVSMVLFSVFSEHFMTWCFLSIEDSFISVLDIENYKIPKLALTDKEDSFSVQL